MEDRIRTGKDTGFGRFPSRVFAINAAWLELALTGIDLLAWTQHLLLDGDLAVAEPKKLRYRLLHVSARLTRSARRTRLRIAERWPWTDHPGRRVHPPRRAAPTGLLNTALRPDEQPSEEPATASGHHHVHRRSTHGKINNWRQTA